MGRNELQSVFDLQLIRMIAMTAFTSHNWNEGLQNILIKRVGKDVLRVIFLRQIVERLDKCFVRLQGTCEHFVLFLINLQRFY